MKTYDKKSGEAAGDNHPQPEDDAREDGSQPGPLVVVASEGDNVLPTIIAGMFIGGIFLFFAFLIGILCAAGKH